MINNKVVMIIIIINSLLKPLNSQENTFEMIIEGAPDKKGAFLNPAGITIDKNGKIFVVDSLNARVQVFTKEGAYIKKIGRAGSSEGDLSNPEGVTIDKKSGNQICYLCYNPNEMNHQHKVDFNLSEKYKKPNDILFGFRKGRWFVIHVITPIAV